MNPQNQIVIFESPDQPVQVRLEGDTVWLSQAQMAELFGTSADNISLHLKNIFKDKELEEPATTEDFSVVRQEAAVEQALLDQLRALESSGELHLPNTQPLARERCL